eukprot:2936116-Pyramimonas_sp.AAC.1
MAAELPSFSVPSKPARASRAGCSGPFAVAGIDWGEGGTSYLAEAGRAALAAAGKRLRSPVPEDIA